MTSLEPGDLATSPDAGEKPRRNRRLPREVRVRQIQAAALQVFREHGYAAGSISEIARLAGLAEGALYKFYGSKREILESVICQWYEVTLEEYKAAYDDISDPRERMKFAIRHNLDCLCNDVAIANLYLELRRDKDFRSSRLTEFNKEYIGLMKATIRELQGRNSGGRPALKPSLIAEMIYSMIETKTELYRFGERRINRAEIVDQIYELTLRVI